MTTGDMMTIVHILLQFFVSLLLKKNILLRSLQHDSDCFTAEEIIGSFFLFLSAKTISQRQAWK